MDITFPLETSSVAVQCNLLNAPPLKTFSNLSAPLDDSFITESDEPEPDEERDLDTSLRLSQDEYSTE